MKPTLIGELEKPQLHLLNFCVQGYGKENHLEEAMLNFYYNFWEKL